MTPKETVTAGSGARVRVRTSTLPTERAEEEGCFVGVVKGSLLTFYLDTAVEEEGCFVGTVRGFFLIYRTVYTLLWNVRLQFF